MQSTVRSTFLFFFCSLRKIYCVELSTSHLGIMFFSLDEMWKCNFYHNFLFSVLSTNIINPVYSTLNQHVSNRYSLMKYFIWLLIRSNVHILFFLKSLSKTCVLFSSLMAAGFSRINLLCCSCNYWKIHNSEEEKRKGLHFVSSTWLFSQ